MPSVGGATHPVALVCGGSVSGLWLQSSIVQPLFRLGIPPGMNGVAHWCAKPAKTRAKNENTRRGAGASCRARGGRRDSYAAAAVSVLAVA